MTTAKEKLARASQLTKQGEFDKARKIIKSIDHPKQADWLSKIDDKEFGDPFAAFEASPAASNRGRRWARIILLSLLAFFTPIAVYFTYTTIQQNHKIDVQGRVSGYCRDIFYDLQDYDGADVCFDWAFSFEGNRFDVAEECDKRAGKLDSEFHDCMVAEDILPPGIFRR